MFLAAPCVYRFGEFELQPGERRLLRAGQAVALTPKAFDLLVLLVEREGRLISKDELLTTLWPRSVVIESNLTKHIWLVRRALGEANGDRGYIQTVSKLGYRFAAPATKWPAAQAVEADNQAAAVADVANREAPVGDAGTIGAGPLRARTLFSWSVWAAFAGAAMVLAGGLAWFATTRPNMSSSFRPSPGSGASVAVIGLTNLSRDPTEAWIGPGLVEMLGTDIVLDGRARMTPDEVARAASAGFAPAGAGGYAPASLALFRRRSGADFVISGSYLVFGPGRVDPDGGDRDLRLDFAVQDARSGRTIVNLTRSGPVSGLPALARDVGADLRRSLGLASPSGADRALASAADPPTSDVMRHMGFGLQALHDYDPARARDEFIAAIVEAPSYAPAYAELAQAWSALGYQGKARAAAEQAAAHAAGLPQIERLRIEAQVAEARFDWPATVARLRVLVGLSPRDPEPRLQLIDALLKAGKPVEAQAAFADLRGLGSVAADDARVELAAARVAAARDDSAGRTAHAARALELAHRNDLSGLAADAETQLGIARTAADPKGAAAMLERAFVDYGRVGNPRGQAWARQNLGNLYLGNDPARARQEYQSALAQYQTIGDQAGAAKVYSDLAIVLWSSGDRDAAEAAARQSLRIRRQTGDIAGQAWALAALAVAASDEAASDDSVAGLREAITLDEAAGARSHLVFALYSLSDIQRVRGELGEARRTCAAAQAAAAGLHDPANRAPADFECALIALDLGRVAEAQAVLRRARATATTTGDAMTVANADLTLGQVELGLRHFPAAATLLAAAETECVRGDFRTGQVVSASLLALADAALGRDAQRDRAAERARRGRAAITERQEVLPADIALALLRGQAPGQSEPAAAALSAMAEDARGRRWLNGWFEARLAAVQLTGKGGAELAARARAAAFGWVVQRLTVVAAAERQARSPGASDEARD